MTTRSLRGALYVVAAPLLVLGGCRGVVGIHDLDVVSDGGSEGGGGGAEGGVDAGKDVVVAGDTGSDAPVAVVTIDAGCQQSTGMACGMCCRMSPALMPAFAKLDRIAKSTGCVCGAGACSTECGNDVCMDKPSTMGCGGCVDMNTRAMPGTSLAPLCMDAVTECMADAVCVNAPACQHSCNP